jgi:ABC transporter substrate binding protein
VAEFLKDVLAGGAIGNAASLDGYRPMLAAFHRGLQGSGYVEGGNVAIEYRWADYQIDRLPALAADLVHRQVTVIVATTTPAAVAAKAATTTIPIAFEMGGDPIRLGLVANLNRPGGNVTGVTNLNAEVAPKRVELLHELVPTASVIALLVDPTDPGLAEPVSRASQAAAHALGLHLHVLNASTERDFDAVFSNLTHLRAGGLVIGPGALFATRSEQLAALAIPRTQQRLSRRIISCRAKTMNTTSPTLQIEGTFFAAAFRWSAQHGASVLRLFAERKGPVHVRQLPVSTALPRRFCTHGPTSAVFRLAPINLHLRLHGSAPRAACLRQRAGAAPVPGSRRSSRASSREHRAPE